MATWLADRLVRAHAAEAGTEPAVIDGTALWRWADLDAQADALAAGSAGAGVTAGAVVALLAEPSGPGIAGLLAILRAGAIAAPVPTGLATPELSAALGVLSPTLVLHDAGLGTGVAAAGYAGLAIDVPHAVVAGAPSTRVQSPGVSVDPVDPRDPEGPVDPEDPAVIVLTSGTTGRPKGVILSARAMATSAESWLGALPPATGWILALGLGHVAGLGVLWRSIARRVPLRIVGRGDPDAMLAAFAADPPASHISLVPAQLVRLLDAAGDAPPPPTLRAVLLGGGSIPPSLVTRAARAGWPVFPTYGLSETGSGATVLPAPEALGNPGSAGCPLPGVQIRIEEPDADGVGEIVVESAARFSGYAGDPAPSLADATAPVHTGDLGRLDDAGRLFVVDRRFDRIVRGGENIAPAEVEAVLLAHPAVADAAVVGCADPLWGHVPAAAVVIRPGVADPDDEALAAHARASLAGFKVPVTFLRLDALPRTAGGKLRREAVRAMLAGKGTGELARPDGARIGWRISGEGPLPLLLLHGTLSNAAQLDRLAIALARAGDITVHALDRRGSGTGRLAPGAPVAGLDIAVHVADLVAYLDARGIGRAVVVGVSFGGVLGIELAARHPDRVAAVVAWEPPYGPLGDEETQAVFATLAAATADAYRTGGPAAAAETFLRAVAGDAAWDRLPARSRSFLAREGDGAAVDASLIGARPAGLREIVAPVTILTGGASEPFYTPIADALGAWIPGASRATLEGLAHPAPITEPGRVADAVRAALATIGVVPPPTDPESPA